LDCLSGDTHPKSSTKEEDVVVIDKKVQLDLLYLWMELFFFCSSFSFYCTGLTVLWMLFTIHFKAIQPSSSL
jgi:hypothetical protein